MIPDHGEIIKYKKLKRERIAIAAMQGILSGDSRWMHKETFKGGAFWEDPELLAQKSFQIADAMIKESEK